jgi:hypothetical protein
MSLVQKVTTDEQILATREVMRQLRPKLSPDDYLTTVKRMQQTDGYRLAAVSVYRDAFQRKNLVRRRLEHGRAAPLEGVWKALAGLAQG